MHIYYAFHLEVVPQVEDFAKQNKHLQDIQCVKTSWLLRCQLSNKLIELTQIIMQKDSFKTRVTRDVCLSLMQEGRQHESNKDILVH